MNEETKKLCTNIGTAMMVTGLGLMAYSVYEAVDNEKQQRDRFQQIEDRIEKQSTR